MIKDLEITTIEGRRLAPIDNRPQEVRIDSTGSLLSVVARPSEFQRRLKTDG